jgi:hypothetical protein
MPLEDFGLLVDSQSFGEQRIGIQLDAFQMYSKAIFGNNVLNCSQSNCSAMVRQKKGFK